MLKTKRTKRFTPDVIPAKSTKHSRSRREPESRNVENSQIPDISPSATRTGKFRDDTTEKLQKVLARSGLGSRRQLEEWIQAGRVSVNGNLAKLGDRVTAKDRILVDGDPIAAHALEDKKTRVLLYHKPEGEICTRSDPEGRPTVFDHLPLLRYGRWISVGRLDINSAGLLIFTNDGELANRLMHPSANLEREYAVRVFGEVDDAMLRRLKKGVELEDGVAKFTSITDKGGEGRNHWYHVTIGEGRKREVRRLWESQSGIKVSRLIRIRFGKVLLPPQLRSGKWVELEVTEISEYFDEHSRNH